MKFPWRQKSRQDQLSEELRSHIEMSAQDRINRGASPKAAAEAARREFGNVALIQNVTSDQWTWTWLDNLAQDFHYAARTLRKNPAFATIAVLTLALGIGANTAIFSVVHGVLLRPLPFANASTLLDVSARSTLFDFENLSISLADIADVRASASSFATLTPYASATKELAGDGKPERLEGADITEDFFPTLGITPLLGRTFTSTDMQPGSRAVVISHALWRERFGADSNVIGKSLLVDDQPKTVIGVMPPLSHTGFATDDQLWSPLVPSDDQRNLRQSRDFSVLARLQPNATPQQAQQELDTITARLAAAYPDTNKGWTMHATPIKKFLLGDARTPLLILSCAVGFVLLIACANVSNLFLSRGWSRRREFAIRSALGATRGALLRQLLVESLLVALAGGACAFLVAAWAMQALRSLLPPETPRIQEIGINAQVAFFTVTAALVAAILSGLAPALLGSRADVNTAIKEGSAGASSGAGHNFLRRLLAAGEVAVAAILLIGAALAVQSFARLLRAELGFRPEHIVTMRIEFPEFHFEKPEQGIAFVNQVLENSRAVHGVQAASAGLIFPLGDYIAETTFRTEKTASDPRLGEQMAVHNQIAPDFFRTFGIPLLAGRDFNGGDAKDRPPVFVINEALARKYFGSVDVVGKRLSTRRVNGQIVWGEIVGVVGNVREARPAEKPKVEIYTPYSQARMVTGIFLAVRTNADPMAIVPVIQDRVWSLDKNRPISMIKTVDQQIAEDFAAPRSQSLLLSIFSGLGFVLALVGVYGVISYIVSQQTREIGIRMALGAAPENILRAVITDGLKLTLAGVTIGLGASFGLTRFLRTLLFELSPTDPLTFATVAIALTLVAIAACYIPARRAMTVDPMIALRHE
jgi:putative ABC transport system permease protein